MGTTQNINTCCSGLDAIELFEMLPDVIPEEAKTPQFCLEYEHALNRIRYECYKGIGKPRKINKAVKPWHKDSFTCGVCGFGAGEPHYKFCPNCGTHYLDNPYTQKGIESHQMSIDEWLGISGENTRNDKV